MKFHHPRIRMNGGGAIVVVSVSGSVMPQTREHISLARQVSTPNIIVYLNKVDLVDDPELPELVEEEVKDVLTQNDLPGDNTEISGKIFHPITMEKSLRFTAHESEKLHRKE